MSATRHLSWEEDAAFRRLLDTYYTTEKALPADLRQVCRLVLATTESQRQAVETVLGEFFQLTEFGWINTRADAEIVEMQRRQSIAKDKANKRWDKHRAEHSIAPAMPQHKENDAAASNSDANAMLPTPTPTPVTAKAVVRETRKKQQVPLPYDFYPNDVGKDAAIRKGVDADTELEKFRNFHLAKASTMADWQAAWRTWVGNARTTQTPVVSASDRHPKWAIDAGFANVEEANNDRCFERNAHEFRNGQRILKVVA